MLLCHTPLQLCNSPISFPAHRACPPQYLRPCQRTVTVLNGAHIPLSGRNPILKEVLGIRPHILVLNKMDLADPSQQPTVLEHLKQQQCSHVVFADCKRDVNVKKIVPMVAKLVDNSPRYHRAESTEYSIMVIGVPNVGKSSLINSLRRLHLKKGKATPVGGDPGITKAVLTRIQVLSLLSGWMLASAFSCSRRAELISKGLSGPLSSKTLTKLNTLLVSHMQVCDIAVTKQCVLTALSPSSQVCEKPLMYLVDTPGVLAPNLGDVETGMKLALCGAIRDHLVGEDIMADYLLYALNKRQQFRYVQRYGLAEACDDIGLVLRHVALAQGRTQKVKVLTGTGNVNMMMLSYPAAAYEFLRDFRAGRLGRVTLD
ncbi:mitochondrial ribosome-associated GTPase 1 isoform X1 [Neopsephotus bourkii]|uniref:mitochondrial ribosome-associated GTPase 1 isoform X1 n=1 Tax=Neopsephotus bourkii TaxID=309878 RepID=UPI002AA5BC43|nr:mitochondrial ribosome-associated GTPase 1 isoform X1 [Neopsephotus bourkii]